MAVFIFDKFQVSNTNMFLETKKKIANKFSRLEKPVQSQQQRFQTKGIGSFLAFLILMLNRCLFIGFGPVIFIVLFKLSLMSQYKILIPLLLAEQRCTA